MPWPLRKAGYIVLGSNDAFRTLVWVALGVHVLEAAISATLTARRGYDAKVIAWNALITFLYGFPGMEAALFNKQ